MAIFNPIVITNSGKSILAQAIGGQGTITFTAVSTSTTVMSGDLEDTTELTNIKQTVIPSTAMMTDDTIQVSSVFSNAGVSQEYTVNTLGLYAKLDSDPILFAIATASSPDIIPAQNTLSPSNFYYQFNISTGGAADITVDLQEDGNLTSAAFYSIFPGLIAPTANNYNNMLVYESPGQWVYREVPSTTALEATVESQGEDISSLQSTVQSQGEDISSLQSTVQSQGESIDSHSQKLAGIGLVKYISSSGDQTGENIALSGVTLSANTLYMVNINVQIKEETGEKEFTPTLTGLVSSLRLIIATGTKTYIKDASGNLTYINETFLINSGTSYSNLQFSLDDNEHTFGLTRITIFELGKVD